MPRPMKDSGVEWLAEIPADWKIKKLKYISSFIQTKYSKDDGKLNYIGLENIVSWNGKFIETDSIYDLEQSLICEAGDILFGKLRPYLAKVYLNTNKQCCSGEFAVIRIDDSMCRQFFFYQLISHGFIFMVDRSTYGTKMPRANADFIKNVCVAFPPLDEQQRIATFLDGECVRIDSVIEKTRASIVEYKKLKQAIITRAVTKGIRPARTMKDSGVEWLGEIPTDWEIHKLKHSIEWKSEKGQPNATVLSLYRDYGVIPKSSRDDNHNVTSLDTSTYKVVSKGDFVINKMKAWQGSMAVSDYDGIVSPAYHVCVITNPDIFLKYFHYLLRNQLYLPEYKRLSTGMRIGQWDLGFEDFKNLPFILPPMEEQKEIAQYLDEKTAAIDLLVEKKNQLVTELERLKKSLIFEYVTGKKELTGGDLV